MPLFFIPENRKQPPISGKKKEGKKVGRKKERKEGRKKQRKEGGKKERKEGGKKERKKERKKEKRKKEKRKEGRRERKKERKKKQVLLQPDREEKVKRSGGNSDGDFHPLFRKLAVSHSCRFDFKNCKTSASVIPSP